MRRGTSIGAGLVLAMVLGRAVPGCGTASFVCEGDESCAGLEGGQCEPDGHCSIPDDDCGSGRRYAAHSGSMSGHCVSDEATDSGTTAGSESEDQSGPDVDATSVSPSTGSDSGEPPAEACNDQPIVEEPFTALPLDPSRWIVMNDAGIAVNVLDGALRLSAVDATLGYAELGGAFFLPSSGSVGVELLAGPAEEVPGEAYVVLTDFEISYGFHVSDGRLELLLEDSVEPIETMSLPHDPVAHRWLRIVFDPGEDRVAWEAAPAVGEWEVLQEAELETGFEPEESFFMLGAGVWDGPTSAELAAFGHAFACGDY
jgi:hypothetical protein